MRKAGFLLLWAVAVGVIGCSQGTLDRKTTTKTINEAFSKQRERIPVRVGGIGLHCETRIESGKTETQAVDPKFGTDRARIATAAGYIDVVPDGEDSGRSTLTDTGRAFVRPITLYRTPPYPVIVDIRYIHCRLPQLRSLKLRELSRR